jgi:hypothetical protein
MTWVRIVVYKGSADWIDQQRAKSLPEGLKELTKGNRLTVRTLWAGGFWWRLKELLRIIREA